MDIACVVYDMTTPIPQPPAIPFLGNITAIDNELPLRSFRLLAKQYGEIYQLNLMGECRSCADLDMFQDW